MSVVCESRWKGLSWRSRTLKRSFDIFLSLCGILLAGWLIIIAVVLASLDTRRWGLFTQERIGRHGKTFRILKIRTMRDVPNLATTVTSSNDPRITRLGRFFRRTKLDELPQLFNILLGHMSFVGPRPDMPGFADKLEGEDRIILSVRPGLVGPATLKYVDEERTLTGVADPEEYNRRVLYPDKVRLNRTYIERYRFLDDLKYLFTAFIRIIRPTKGKR